MSTNAPAAWHIASITGGGINVPPSVVFMASALTSRRTPRSSCIDI